LTVGNVLVSTENFSASIGDKVFVTQRHILQHR
jgi:hypothetical protein